MKFNDIEFKAEDCCGQHASATVTLADGREIGIVRGDDLYTITYYDDGGVVGREVHVTQARVEQVIA